MRKITLSITNAIVSNIRSISLSGILILVILLPAFAQVGRVHALFSLETLVGGPFPSDLFTVADQSQNTGLRINLPKPDCLARPSDGVSGTKVSPLSSRRFRASMRKGPNS